VTIWSELYDAGMALERYRMAYPSGPGFYMIIKDGCHKKESLDMMKIFHKVQN
jgi:hypothetical protein